MEWRPEDVNQSNIDAFLSQKFGRQENTAPVPKTKGLSAEEKVAGHLRSLAESRGEITTQEINKILKEANTSIENYCICQSCAGQKENKEVHYIGEGIAPIAADKVPSVLVESTAINFALCPEHKVRLDLLGNVAYENSTDPLNMDWEVLPEESKIKDIADLNKKAKQEGKGWIIYDYPYSNLVKGKKIIKERKVLFFLDRKQYPTQDSKDRVINGIISPNALSKQPAGKPEAQDDPSEELLPKGKIEMNATEIRMEIKFGGEEMVFNSYPSITNNILIRNGNGNIQIDVTDPKKIVFRGKLAPRNEADLSETEKTELRSAREKAIRILIGNYRDIAQMIQNNPELRKKAEKFF